MWRHAVSECLQIGHIGLGGFTAVGESPFVVPVFVQPLTAGDELDAAEDQIERVRPVWVVRLGWV
jgi:hypothetical protein